MNPNIRDRRTLSTWRASLFLGLGLLAGSSPAAGDGIWGLGRRKAASPVLTYRVPAAGTLGYGPPGLHPGFQGFGLGYHPGHGYGGDALGTGAFGGYPFYGGPGYPHPAPALRRIGGINPFPYYGGPGYPTPAHPNAFGPVGPLVVDRPVVTIRPEPGEIDHTGGFGPFTGTLPYPQNYFAPFASQAAADGTTRETGTPPPSSGDDGSTPD
jgi:hypothetical protein